jgi:hypothetical protein
VAEFSGSYTERTSGAISCNQASFCRWSTTSLASISCEWSIAVFSVAAVVLLGCSCWYVNSRCRVEMRFVSRDVQQEIQLSSRQGNSLGRTTRTAARGATTSLSPRLDLGSAEPLRRHPRGHQPPSTPDGVCRSSGVAQGLQPVTPPRPPDPTSESRRSVIKSVEDFVREQHAKAQEIAVRLISFTHAFANVGMQMLCN